MSAQPPYPARLGTWLLIGLGLFVGLIGLVIAGLLPAQLTLYAALAASGLVYLLVAGHLGRLTR